MNSVEAVNIIKSLDIKDDDDKHSHLFNLLNKSTIPSNTVSNCFKALHKAGANPQRTEDFSVYIEVLENPTEVVELAPAIQCLHEAGASIPVNLPLFWSLIRNGFYATKLSPAIRALRDIGANLVDDEELFVAIMQNASLADNMPSVFSVLKNAQIQPKGNKDLYLAAIKKTPHPKALERCLNLLKANRLTLEANTDCYVAILRVRDQLDRIDGCFKALEAISADPQVHKKLYLTVISKRAATELTSVFNTLQTAGLTLTDNPGFYLYAIKNIEFFEKLGAGLAALKYLGATIQTHPELYEALGENLPNIHNLLPTFKALCAAKATLKDNYDMFLMVTATHHDFTNLALLFQTIVDLGVILPDYLTWFKEVIDQPYRVNDILVGVNFLKQLGLTIQDDKEIYLAQVQKRHINGSNLKKFQALLNTCALLAKHSKPLFRLFLERTVDIDDMAMCVKFFTLQGFNIQDHHHFYETALNKPTLASTILTKLSQLGLDNRSHYIYELFFCLETATRMPSHSISIRMLAYLTKYLEKKPLLVEGKPGYTEQKAELLQHLQELIDEDRTLTLGPLNKSSSTKELERLLRRITKKKDNLSMHFDPSHGFVLILNNEAPIYINHLLDQVNFNHLELHEGLVNRIGVMLQAISSSFDYKHDSPELSELPEAAQMAVKHYIGASHYKNINRLFRGVPLQDDEKFEWLKPVAGTANLLVHFLCGCLVNWAAKELPLRYLETVEGRIPQSQQELLIRGEFLDNTEELGTRARRLANPIITPSVTSVSVYKKGSPFFQKTETVLTHFENTNAARPTVNCLEGEQLIPHGTSFIYSQNPEGGFFAKEVNSPRIIPTGSYWSAVALSNAAVHLLKKYKDAASEIIINGIEIVRPNHGIPHTHRVVTLINVVKNYFAHHAEDEEFRLFCQCMTKAELEWLMVTAAFSITGRESEIAAIENLTRYDAFRQASQEHLTAFLKVHPPKVADAAMQERMEHIVRYMGNPAYEKATATHPAINQHSNAMEQKHRNFLHRILTIAHKLDLPRCYEPDKFDAALASCRALSKTSPEQKADYTQMLTYSIKLIKAHGNTLHTGINEKGELVPERRKYEAPFERVSHNLRDLQAMTDTVPRPKLTEAYQFPHKEHAASVEYIRAMCK